jgi:hypothetical protein
MTPATVPRPTVPSQLPESFAVCLKAMQIDMNCPVCSRGEKPKVGPPFASFSGLVAHLSDKRDAEHVAWRAQNAELLVQLCVAAKQSTPAQRLARKQMQAAARAAAEQQQQEQRAKLLEKQQATFDNLEAEVKAALLQLRGADEDARKTAGAQFRAWIPTQISAAGRYCSPDYLFQRSIEIPTLSELKRGGFEAANCSRSGFSMKQIRKAGYTATELCASPTTLLRATTLLGPKAARGSQSDWMTNDGYYTWSEVAGGGFTEAALLEVLDNLLVTQLRSALESRGLDSNGLRKDLIARMLQPEPAESAKRKASELALHDEEQMQDVQAAGLADEVAGLRARLVEETQARQRAEMAQEEMRSAKRARLAQSDREAAAVAWRDAAGSTGAMEVVDSGGFMARFLAFRQARSCHLHAPPAASGTAPASERAAAPCCHTCTHHACVCVQHIETLLTFLPTKTTKAKVRARVRVRDQG